MSNCNDFTVFMPTYNDDRYIKYAIESILKQSFTNFKLVVFDNHSTDNTREIVHSFHDDRVVYFCNEKNIGPGNNFNNCLKSVETKFFSIFHSDDIYEETIIEKSRDVLINNPHVAAVFSNMVLINEKNETITRHWYNPPSKIDFFNYEKLLFTMLNDSNPLPCPTFVGNSFLIKNEGLFNIEEYRFAIDTEMWLRIARKHQIAYINEKLLRYRISASQDSQIELKYKQPSEHFKVIDREIEYAISQQIEIPPELYTRYRTGKARDYIRIATNYCFEGNYIEGRKYLEKSISEAKLKPIDEEGIKQYLISHKLYNLLDLFYKKKRKMR